MLTAFIFIALLGVAALVVDIVTIHQARLRAQATVDATVLAAALDLDDIDAATLVAKEYAGRNYDVADGDWTGCVDGDTLAVATTVPCISIDDADSPTLIRVRLPNRRVPSFFSSVLGRNGFDVSAVAVAEVEFVMVSAGSPGHGVGPGRTERSRPVDRWVGDHCNRKWGRLPGPGRRTLPRWRHRVGGRMCRQLLGGGCASGLRIRRQER